MSGNRNKTIAFNYFGSKFTWIDKLYAHFPKDIIHFVDLFGGSLAVSLNYPFKGIITANEINSEITNFFEVLRDREDELLRLLNLTPVSKLEYDNSWEPSENKLEAARRFYVRARQSFFSLGIQRKNKGWHMAKTQSNAIGGETVSKWNNALPKLYEVAYKLRQIQITNFHYADCIKKIDFPGAFFYCDPPYVKESRASFNDYKYEFTKNDHIDLADQLHNIKGKAMVSGYNSDLYDELYKNWNKVMFPIKKNNIRSSEVQEVIWINYSNSSYDLFSQEHKQAHF